MIKLSRLVFLLSISVFVITNAQSQDALSRQKNYLVQKGVALSGYDPLSYFQNKPQKGKISYVHNGITYKFVSVNNLENFKKTPAKYEPAYGGWCAYAMGAKGEKVEVDPENYKIKDGVLLLFYKNIFSNTLDDWNKEEPKLKKQADLNWKKFQ